MTRLFRHELRNQQRLFWRSRESAFFTFLLPIIFLLLLGSLYGDEEIDGVNGATYLLAGMLGYGVVATAFAGLAINLVLRRESGVLKRVRGTPLPPATYLAAVIASTLVVIAIEAVVQVLIARYAIDAALPDLAGRFIVALLLGSAAFAALGLAVTGAVRTGEGSSAVINADLPADDLHLGRRSSRSTRCRAFSRRSPTCSRSPTSSSSIRDVYIEGEGLGSSWTAIGVRLALGRRRRSRRASQFRWEPREA